MKRWADLCPGYSALPYTRQIGRLVFETRTRSILDYGSGAGKQYHNEGIDRAWGVTPVLYDPAGGGRFRDLPDRVFDGVICTDVLHYIDQTQLLHEVLPNLRKLAGKWCFVAISTHAGGRPERTTVRSVAWWREVFDAEMRKAPARLVVVFMP